MTILYADGGVINKNPSPLGGTWAWVLVSDDDKMLLDSDSGYITKAEIGGDVTNNQMEFLAVVRGLLNIREPHKLKKVCSDSNVTLGRLFKDWSITNIPDWILEERNKALKNYDTRAWSNGLMLDYVLLAGHPTEYQLRTGIGKNGNPVSRWNVLCDKMCNDEAWEFLQNYGE